jgi:tetratricopeptide (TPR) repeat protein
MSTSRDKQTALAFACPSTDPQSSETQALLLEIHADLNSPMVLAADVTHLSHFPEEQEIIFDIGNTFLIQTLIYEPSENVWHCRFVTITDRSLLDSALPNDACLTLDADTKLEVKMETILQQQHEHKLKTVNTRCENETLSHTESSVPWLASNPTGMARLFCQRALMNLKRDQDVYGCHSNLKRAWEIYRDSREGQVFDQHDIAFCLNALGHVSQMLVNPECTNNFFKRSLDIRSRIEPPNYFIAQTLRNLGLAYADQGSFHNAFPCLLRALTIDIQTRPNVKWSMCMSFRSLGLAYHRQSDYVRAAHYLFRAFDSFQRFNNHC